MDWLGAGQSRLKNPPAVNHGAPRALLVWLHSWCELQYDSASVDRGATIIDRVLPLHDEGHVVTALPDPWVRSRSAGEERDRAGLRRLTWFGGVGFVDWHA